MDGFLATYKEESQPTGPDSYVATNSLPARVPSGQSPGVLNSWEARIAVFTSSRESGKRIPHPETNNTAITDSSLKAVILANATNSVLPTIVARDVRSFPSPMVCRAFRLIVLTQQAQDLLVQFH